MIEPLAELKHAIESADSLSALRGNVERIAASPGTAYRERTVYGATNEHFGVIDLQRPLPVADVCRAFGWAGAHAVAVDVHQQMWTLQLWVQDLEDPHGPRIHTRYPRVGIWTVVPHLGGRPPGPLPGVSAGASPAYPLGPYAATVQSFELRAY